MSKTLTFPGFVDVHVHFRDPGVPEAETTASGLAAARRGGFAAVVTMPNTTPAVDSPELVRRQLLVNPPIRQSNTRPIEQSNNRTILLPSACITRGRLGREVADLETLAEAGAAFFTDDGSYVADDKVMEAAMRRVADLNMVVCQHAMDPRIQAGGVIRDCALARRLNLPVVSVATETTAIRRDLSLCRETGCRLHIQHISTAEGVTLVRDAQKEGLPVTAEATPHHLLLTCDDIPLDDSSSPRHSSLSAPNSSFTTPNSSFSAPNSSFTTPNSSFFILHSSFFKMAPPLGTREDRAELRKAVKEGALMFATDHAPHPAAKKSLGFLASANGIIGLETAIPITYAVMVEEEGMSVDAWAKAWYELPRAIVAGIGSRALPETTVEIGAPRAVDVASFASLSRNCPYDGLQFTCWPKEG